MKITNAIILKTIVIAALGGAMAACQSTPAVSNNNAATPVNSPATNAARTETNAANKPAVPEISDKAPAGSFDTPHDAYKFAYAARQKKDVAALKRVMSKDALEFLEIVTEPGKTVDDTLLKMTETPQAETDVWRSEKTNGDRATLEYPDPQGNWKKMDLVREDGGWKLTFPKPDSSTMKK